MPYKLEVDLPSVNKGADYALLVGKTDVFPYENGQKSSDVRTGVKLTIALQNSRLSTLTVKYDHDPIPKLTDEEIELSNSKLQFVFVKIPDCSVNLFSSSGGGIGMSATAQTAQIVTLGK